MAAFTSIAVAAGVGLAGAGAYLQYQGSREQARAQRNAFQHQQQAEATRQKAVQLDAMRRRREMIRQMILARSTAVANATSQGASQGSGLQGGFGQISGRTGVNLLGVNQNEMLGNEIFAANQGATSAYSRVAQGGSTIALGQGLSSLGGGIINNLGAINSLSAGFGGGGRGGSGFNFSSSYHNPTRLSTLY